MIAGMRLAREIAAQAPLRELVIKELKPGAGASSARSSKPTCAGA